ncbi:MAG: tetratricopeptide (TPR) repeat protein [Algoriphagus sp.]
MAFKIRNADLIFAKIAGRFGKYLCIVSVFIYSINCNAQSQGYFDSLTLSKNLLNEGLIREASEILKVMESSYPGDENLIRVRGQAFYWSKDFGKTKEYFSKSIAAYPALQFIKLDYGRILYELQSFREAVPVLESFILENPDDPEANQLLGQLNYWLGRSPKKSVKYLDKILDPYPDNEAAKALKQEIEKATSPVFSIYTGYFSDSQPMNFSFLEGEFGFYTSALLQPKITASISSYQAGQLISTFTLRNTSSFIPTGTTITLSGGFVASTSWENGVGLYGLQLDQKIKSGFTLNLAAAKESYFYTLSSLDQTITPTTLKASFGRDYEGKFTGRLWIQHSSFEDDNFVNSFGAWFLYPVLKLPFTRIELGYSYTHGDSKEVRFGPHLPIQNRGNTTDAGTIIPGSYQPYFTPINQQIHGVLAKFTYSPNSSIKLDVTGNIGLKATIDNPNMIFYGIGNSLGNRPIVEEDLFLLLNPISYTPWDLSFNFNWELSDYSAFKLSYGHQTTIFFNSNTLSLKFTKRLKR